MLKQFAIITIFSFLFNLTFAQTKYVAPAAIEHAHASISLESIEGSSRYAYLKIKIKNKTEGYLNFDNTKTSFIRPTGTKYSTFGSSLIPPNSQRSTNAKGEIGENVDEFDLRLEGLSYAAPSNNYLNASALAIEDGNSIQVGDFEVKVIKVNTSYKKKNTARVEVKYNGKGKVGVVDFKAFKVDGFETKTGKGKLGMTEGFVLKAYIDVKTKDEGLSFNLTNAFQELTLSPIRLNQVNIKKEGWVPKFSPVHAVNGSYKPFAERTNSANKIVIFNTNNEGFKVFCEGAERTNIYTTNATLGMNPGPQNIQIMMDGIPSPAIQTSITIDPKTTFAKYQITKNAEGIYSLNFVEGSAVMASAAPSNNQPAASTATTTAAAPTGSCELSFSDFSQLKNDINAEANSGGNPAGLAAELLSVKRCISTAQVVSLMEAFNLDNNRLQFAKNAYKHTSDKNKYFQVVQKLSYNKNKEALEMFMSAQ